MMRHDPSGTRVIDLNADLGEDPAGIEDGREGAMLGVVSSVSIACGGHAGDPRTMRTVLAMAAERGVAIGAHPGYPDRSGFGRIAMALDPEHIEQSVRHQISVLMDCADAIGATIVHVKPHGALYHAASNDPAIAEAILSAIRSCDHSLALIARAGSPALLAWRESGARVIGEAFADRRYRADGTLLDRTEPGALIDSADDAAAQGLQIVMRRKAMANDGHPIPIDCQTLCVHGDTPGAAAIARRIRRALHDAGVIIRPWNR